MSAPVLPLRGADLNTLKSVGILAAWMLFPEDEARRNKIIARYCTQDFLFRMESLPPESTLRFNPAQLTEVLAIALDAANKHDVEEWHTEREPTGCDIGAVAWLAIQGIILGNPTAIADATEKVERIRRGGKVSTSSDLKNKRTLFKPVTALWAAYIETFDPDDPGLFPCQPNAVVPFLTIAEGFRRLGESARAKRQGDPIIPIGTSVQLPGDVLGVLPVWEATVQAKSGTV